MKLKAKVRAIKRPSQGVLRPHGGGGCMLWWYIYAVSEENDLVTFGLAATCLAEMSAMMNCWRENTFEDVPCSKEIQMFLECSARVV